MTARSDLATAANTVDGVNVTEFWRQTAHPGQGWVRLDRTDYPDIFGGIDTWQVLIVVSTNDAVAEQWIEANIPDLLGALRHQMIVRQTSLRSYPTPEKQVIPVLVIEGTREAD